MAATHTDILMYHSIADAPGPTSIAPDIFRAQIEAIVAAGIPVVSLDDLLDARAGGTPLPANALIITFDDGFQDFADTAWPVMQDHGISPIVYIPTAHVGRAENWQGAHDPARPLMNWADIRDLANAGVSFGSHTVSHPDLTTLAEDALGAELTRARATLEDKLGRAVPHFAPPYGQSTPAVRDTIAQHYQTSVGTRLGRAGPRADIFDLPRLEMFYFTDIQRWKNHLAQKGGAYLQGRRLLREVREMISKPWDRP